MNNSKQAPEDKPLEYFAAASKYLFLPHKSVKDYAFRRQSWDQLEKLAQETEAAGDSKAAKELRNHVQTDMRIFGNEAAKLFRGGNIRHFQKLIRALRHPRPVEVGFNSIVATLRAFDDLYEQLGQCLPSKGEVTELAAQYLKDRGWPPICDREWPRVLKKAGLSSLQRAKVEYKPAKSSQ
jgi:hypothetical protein